MKINKWTMGLAAVGLVSLASVAQAEETLVPVTTALSQTIISGYIDTSAVWNPGTGNANPAPVAYNAGKQDGFNLNVVNLTLEKPLDEGQWSAGYKAELLFGPDAVGFNTSANTLIGGASDFSIKQAYIALRAPIGNGLDLKVGVFDGIVGYESFASYRNPNYTRSYGYTLQPTEHTGVLATYQLNDMFAFSGGIANTLNPGINARSTRAESAKTYMGSVTFTAPESAGVFAGSALYAGIVDGFGTHEEDQTSVYVGATVATPVAGLKVGAAYDQAFNKAVSEPGISGFFGSRINRGYADAISAYASFQATEKMSVHARAEYAKVDPLFTTFDSSTDTFVSRHARVFALTGTVQYDLWQNVISRLEVRWDHSTGGNNLFGGTETSEPTRKNAIMIAANLIYKF